MIDPQKIERDIVCKIEAFGDKLGKLLVWVLSENAVQGPSPPMLGADCTIVVAPDKKVRVFEAFYADLYTSQNPSIDYCDTFFSTINLLTINEERRTTLNSPIFIVEVYEAMQGLKSTKAPAPDGFMAELYKNN